MPFLAKIPLWSEKCGKHTAEESERDDFHAVVDGKLKSVVVDHG